MQSGGQFGMQTMDAALAECVRQGLIYFEVAKERCHNAEEFARLSSSLAPTAVRSVGPRNQASQARGEKVG
jgi:Tfp pilus assembly ATPase PilU